VQGTGSDYSALPPRRAAESGIVENLKAPCLSAWIETKNRGRSARPEVIEEEYAEIEELAKVPA
jgi:hypothetical protein